MLRTQPRHRTVFIVVLALFLIWTLYFVYPQRPRPSHSHPGPSVNIIIATMAAHSTSWTSRLSLPSASYLKVLPYIADNTSAPYHPPLNKGNEALIYLTYLYENYDALSSLTIFTHGQDHSWHVSGALHYSTLHALNTLYLPAVLERGYVNLRISWENACPNWINTSMTLANPAFDAKLKEEEPFVREAFEWTFPDQPVPEILSQPCCSQFAASREAIQSLPREAYKRAMEWIIAARLPSSVTGRVWEHLWQYMFTHDHKAVDCPVEHKALCRYYRICFEDRDDWERWDKVEKARYKLDDYRSALLANGIQPKTEKVVAIKREIDRLAKVTEPWLRNAVVRGRSEKARERILGGEEV